MYFIEYIEELVFPTKESTKLFPAEMSQAINCLKEQENISMKDMFGFLSKMCAMSQKPIVLMIDGKESSSNNQVFIDFLA